MRVDITEQEKIFSSLSVGLATFVSNQFAEYEQKMQVLVEEIKKLREENTKLNKEIEVHKEQYALTQKVPEVERR
jgi:septation ring formation regulator EzrA